MAGLVGGFGRFIRADDFTSRMVDLSGYRCLVAVNHLSDIPENLELVFGDLGISVLIQLERWARSDDDPRYSHHIDRTDEHDPLARPPGQPSIGSARGRCSSNRDSTHSDASWNSSEIRDRRRACSPTAGRPQLLRLAPSVSPHPPIPELPRPTTDGANFVDAAHGRSVAGPERWPRQSPATHGHPVAVSIVDSYVVGDGGRLGGTESVVISNFPTVSLPNLRRTGAAAHVKKSILIDNGFMQAFTASNLIMVMSLARSQAFFSCLLIKGGSDGIFLFAGCCWSINFDAFSSPSVRLLSSSNLCGIDTSPHFDFAAFLSTLGFEPLMRIGLPWADPFASSGLRVPVRLDASSSRLLRFRVQRH